MGLSQCEPMPIGCDHTDALIARALEQHAAQVVARLIGRDGIERGVDHLREHRSRKYHAQPWGARGKVGREACRVESDQPRARTVDRNAHVRRSARAVRAVFRRVGRFERDGLRRAAPAPGWLTPLEHLEQGPRIDRGDASRVRLTWDAGCVGHLKVRRAEHQAAVSFERNVAQDRHGRAPLDYAACARKRAHQGFRLNSDFHGLTRRAAARSRRITLPST